MVNNNPFGLPPHAVNRICAIFRKYPAITKVTVYGSRAMGNHRPGSDIDLCIEAEGLDWTQLLAIATQLDDLLLPWKIDVSLKHTIDNPALLEHINHVGIEIYTPSD